MVGPSGDVFDVGNGQAIIDLPKEPLPDTLPPIDEEPPLPGFAPQAWTGTHLTTLRCPWEGPMPHLWWILLVLLVSPVHAITLQVAPGDSLTSAIAALHAGDTIHLASGVYTQGMTFGSTASQVPDRRRQRSHPPSKRMHHTGLYGRASRDREWTHARRLAPRLWSPNH